MSKMIQAVRGMNDILPDQTPTWRFLEALLCKLAVAYGYEELRTPLLEKTELFSRSIGEVTDIVEKEMYSFDDRNGDSLTLRPEGTAACVRAGIEHNLLYNQVRRLWYMGPMFRHERPQKGRYRQFQQLGVETFGMNDPTIDAELIAFSARIWQELGLKDRLELQLNSLGTSAARAQYREHLVAYFSKHAHDLDEDSQRRLSSNPLRILDSKNPKMQTLIAGAPQLHEHLDTESAEHFARLQDLLKGLNISFTLNPRLVRGLDYYNRTVFEWVMTEAGAQNTVCAGGRYDNLVEQLGGKATPAAGFAIGLERLILLMSEKDGGLVRQDPDVYLIMAGDQAQKQGLVLAERLRQQLPQLKLVVDCVGGNFKNQFKRADKSNAALALILGEEELQSGKVTVKYLREEKPQELVGIEELVGYIGKLTRY